LSNETARTPSHGPRDAAASALVSLQGTRSTCVAKHDGHDRLATSRLTRELIRLEASLLAAERAATSCSSGPGERREIVGNTLDSTLDIASRRAELDRRERALQQRERSVEEHGNLLARAQERMVQTKESLSRAIRRFRSEVDRKSAALAEREQRLTDIRIKLVEDRRALARDQMRHKARLRQP
jgi:hypothetical protein